MSRWKQKTGGLQALDWQSEELLPFAEVSSKVAATRTNEYFLRRFERGHRSNMAVGEEYEKLRVKVLVAGLNQKAKLNTGNLAGDPFS